MAIIKKVGVPTRSTEGAVGDTYIDVKTRKAYVCTGAYRASTGSVDYTWREKEEAEVGEMDIEPETPSVTPAVEEPDESPKDVVEEKSDESPEDDVVPENTKPQKHNYHKRYNKQ